MEREGTTDLGQVPETEDKCSDSVCNPFAALHLSNIGFVQAARVLFDLELNAGLICESTDGLEAVNPLIASTRGETKGMGLGRDGWGSSTAVVGRLLLHCRMNEAGRGLA